MKSFLVTAPRPALAFLAIIMVIWAPDALEYVVGTRFPKAVRALVARAGAVLFRPSALPVQRGVPDTTGFRVQGLTKQNTRFFCVGDTRISKVSAVSYLLFSARRA
jgi:hypothetical protein